MLWVVMPQHRGTPMLQNMVLVNWTQGPWIAKYLATATENASRVSPALSSECERLMVNGWWWMVNGYFVMLKCQCLMLLLQSMPARGRSASGYEAADKKNKNSTVYGQWSTLDRQEMNRDVNARTECVRISISISVRISIRIRHPHPYPHQYQHRCRSIARDERHGTRNP